MKICFVFVQNFLKNLKQINFTAIKKKIVDEFFNSTEKKREEFENKFKVASEKITEKLAFLNKDKEIQELNEKINKLEIELQKAKQSKEKEDTKTKK